MSIVDTPGRLIGYRRLTVSTSVVTLSTASDPMGSATGIPSDAKGMVIKIVSANIRVGVGEDPTAANGFPLDAGDVLNDVAPASDLRFIRSGASDATLEVIFYL